MKTINTFLIALFVTIFSVTSFSQTTHNIDFNIYDQDLNLVFDQDSTISIRRGDFVKFINKTGVSATFLVDMDPIFCNNDGDIKIIGCLNDVVINVEVNINSYVFKYKLTVNINTLGVNDLSNINFNIFPNPTTDFLNISGAQIEALQVFDVNGRLVLSETPNASSLNVDVRSLETGFYTVLVNNQQTVRFIKE